MNNLLKLSGLKLLVVEKFSVTRKYKINDKKDKVTPFFDVFQRNKSKCIARKLLKIKKLVIIMYRIDDGVSPYSSDTNS